MESVIDKLSEIETAASRIMESAVEETRRQDNAAEERTSTYDNDTDAPLMNASDSPRLSASPDHGLAVHPDNSADNYQKRIFFPLLVHGAKTRYM